MTELESNYYALWAAAQPQRGADPIAAFRRLRWLGAGAIALRRADGTEPYSDLSKYPANADWIDSLTSSGDPVCHGTPIEAAFLFWLLHGQETVVAVAGPPAASRHEFRPSTTRPHWVSFRQRIGNVVKNVQDHDDCLVTRIALECSTANKAMRITPRVLSLDPAKVAPALEPADVGPAERMFLFTDGSGSYTIDGQVFRGATQFVFTIDEALEPDYADDTQAFDVVQGTPTVTVGATIKLDQDGLEQWYTMIYGTPTPVAGTRPLDRVPSLGSVRGASRAGRAGGAVQAGPHHPRGQVGAPGAAERQQRRRLDGDRPRRLHAQPGRRRRLRARHHAPRREWRVLLMATATRSEVSRTITLGDDEVTIDRPSGRKVAMALALLRAVSGTVRDLTVAYGQFVTEYGQAHYEEFDRVQARLEFPRRPILDPVSRQPSREPDELPDGSANPRAGELVLAPSLVESMTEADWERTGHKLRIPRRPGREEIVGALFDLALERAEEEVYRLLALFAASNAEVAEWRKTGDPKAILAERAEELLDVAYADELLELAVVAGTVVDDAFRAKASEMGDALGNALRLIGLGPKEPTPTVASEEPSSETSSTSKPTSSTDSPEPTPSQDGDPATS